MERTIVTYNDYNHMLDKLVEKIQMSALYGELKYVYGPQRGGLPLAVHLSHHLDLKFIDKGLLMEWNKKELEKTLIVDDIADTGKTIKDLKLKYCVPFITATLFVKDRSCVEPDWFVERVNNWVSFPWEKIDETPNREGYDG
jgi:hypoxanthine phosphoribosyltransferase